MVVKIKKGLDIRLQGSAEPTLTTPQSSEFFALKPPDFPGLTPKLAVKVDDTVKVGSPLFFDKYRPEVKFTAPVSGKVVAVNRGERRRILEVVVKSDGKNEKLSFKKGDPSKLSREEIVKNLLDSGLWPIIVQRPFNIIANPESTPRGIFISGFNSAPLAPDYDFLLKDSKDAIQAGIQALSRLTDGKIRVGVRAGKVSESVFSSISGVEINEFSGPHPAGNVGIQIHHTEPINKGEIVWVIKPQDVALIGKLFRTGQLDLTRIIALTGSEVQKPQYFKITLGESVKNMVANNLKSDHIRLISGNVLTGEKISKEGYVGYYDDQVTVIPEGDYYEFFGWLTPRLHRFSSSHSYFSWLMPKKKFVADTNLHGGHRAYVVTGQYEKVFPMDIYPVQLIKAIMVGDIDLMENLGIYEVAEEDMALCEFVCTSKTEVQAILRQGFENMIKELG
jgi:Na+-transporting NADH:ubiquinone oxidoreductase subunit A